MKQYGDKVRVVFKHFPLSFHKNAQKAAEASECAAEQGKFWQMHDKIFENQQLLSFDQLKAWAKDLKLNISQFNSCLDSGKFAQKVQADMQEGAQKGVDGTPATFVNGILVSGAQPFEAFKQMIDQELAR
jgi:protein-disulfide isomerase